MKTKLSTVCVVAALGMASAASAGVVQFTDEVAFRGGTGDPQHVIDFESYGDGSPVTGQPIIGGDEWADLGVLFAAAEDGEPLSLNSSAHVSPSHSLIAFGDHTSYVITFTSPVASFGVYFVDSDYTSATEQILLKDIDGNVLDVFDMPSSPANSSAFRGYLSSDTAIKEVHIIEDATDGEALLLDNVMYSVPEPATMSLLAVGAGAMLKQRKV